MRLVVAIACFAITLFSLGAGACGDDRAPSGYYVAWDAPDNERLAATAPPPTHPESDGVALSRNGRFAAIAVAGDPVNELLVVDLEQRLGTRVLGANYRVKLAHPALSADGTQLAMVATPPSYFGIGEIWILSLNTGEIERIGEPNLSYAFPTFSRNGDRLLYFKESRSPLRSSQRSIQPEYRSLTIRYGIAEYDLLGDSEREILPSNLALPCGLGYGAGENSAFACSNSQAVQAVGSAGSVSFGDAQVFRVTWDSHQQGELNLVRLGGLAAFSGLHFQQTLDNGDILFSAASAESERFPPPIQVHYPIGSSDWRYATPLLSGVQTMSPRMSADGATVFGIQQRLSSEDPRGVVTSLLVASRGHLVRFDSNDVVIARTIELNLRFGG